MHLKRNPASKVTTELKRLLNISVRRKTYFDVSSTRLAMSTKPRNQRNWKPFVVEWLTRLLLLLLIYFFVSHQLLYKRIRCSAEGELSLFIALFTLHIDPPHTHCQTILSVFVTPWTRLCCGGCFSLFGQHFLSFGIIQAVVYLKAQIKFPSDEL